MQTIYYSFVSNISSAFLSASEISYYCIPLTSICNIIGFFTVVKMTIFN